MGPVRGIKKRRKQDKNGSASASASGSSEKEGHEDWWEELSKRINGIYFYFFLVSSLYYN